MQRMLGTVILAAALLVGGCTGAGGHQELSTKATRGEPLASWNDGPHKDAIIDFVARVTRKGSADYVEPELRIATFDNDGTLWTEQPMYFQLFFALDRVKALAPQHPEWKNTEPFKSVLDDDLKSVVASGKEGLIKIMAATHAGITAEDFDPIAAQWLATARHPTLDRRFIDCVFQPQLELLEYLRENGFQVFIVSGGGIDFMRAFADSTYGVPVQNVVGSSADVKYEVLDGRPVIMKEPKLDFFDDSAGKPVGIYRHIGRRPILAVGNSDGDFEMLQYTTGGDGARLGMIVHHDDAKREFAYDRDSKIGRLDKALDAAPKNGWIVVSMKNDWATIFPARPAEK